MISEYASRLKVALESIDQKKVDQLYNSIVESIEQDKEIFIIGNGGSAANAIHICGDYMKSLCLSGKRIKISCPTENLSFYTAAANDIDFSETYELLIGVRIVQGDTIVFLSGSGNSINLVKTALSAVDNGINTISITAYGGGRLASICELPIVIGSADMEIAEDTQLALFHYIKQKLLLRYPVASGLRSSKYSKRVYGGEVA